MKKAEFEAQARTLIGHRLERVCYTMLSYDSWDAYPDLFDVSVLQIVLDTESGDRFFCSWSNETGLDYGVSLGLTPYYDPSVLRPEPGLDAREVLHTIVVSERSGWPPCLHEPIVDVRVHWLETSSYDVQPNAMAECRRGEEAILGENDVSYRGVDESPQELEILFESGRSVFVCAASYNHERDALQGLMDELVVIFRLDVATRYAIGRQVT